MTRYRIVSNYPGPGALKKRGTWAHEIPYRLEVSGPRSIERTANLGYSNRHVCGAKSHISASEGKTLGPLFRTSFWDIRTILVGPSWCRIGDLSSRDIMVSCEAVSMIHPSKGNLWKNLCLKAVGVML